MGYAVTRANDEYPDNPLGKAMSKLDLAVARWWTRRVIRRRFLHRRTWDLIIIVKGRGVGPELVRDMRKSATRIVGYHYDSLAYEPAARRWASLVDRVTTFDYHDAKANGWPLVELFATTQPPPIRPTARFTVSAVLRNHSLRLAYVDRVMAALSSPPSFIYFYEKDIFTFATNFLRNPRLYWKWRHHIHRKPLDYERYIDVLVQSTFTIDFAHPKQSGATMRSIEALAMGTRLITNNRVASSSPRFVDARQIVFAIDADPDELMREVADHDRITLPARNRPIEEFMTEVIGSHYIHSTGPRLVDAAAWRSPVVA